MYFMGLNSHRRIVINSINELGMSCQVLEIGSAWDGDWPAGAKEEGSSKLIETSGDGRTILEIELTTIVLVVLTKVGLDAPAQMS